MAWLKKASTTATAIVPLTADWNADVDSSVVAYRAGNVVTVAAWRLGVLAGVTGEVEVYSFPPGFRPPPLFTDRTRDSRGADAYLSGNTVRITNPSRPVSHHSFTFVTLDPMPTGGA